MRYNFTDRMRKVLAMAREEAVRLTHDYVGTEHMLLALAREDGGLGAEILRRQGITPEAVREAVGEAVRAGGPSRALGELPYTSRAKKVLELAMKEASVLGHRYTGTEHLLLGLIREEKGIAARLLAHRGLDLGTARGHLMDLLDDETEASAPPTPASSFRITIDDGSSSSIYEQIVHQVEKAVATGALRPGQRLPTVRRLADELDIAPGTVARAYGELERRGVVVTEGARGTRVAEPAGNDLPEDERRETLEGLLRPVAVAAYHLGASAVEFLDAARRAMTGILEEGGGGT